MTATRRDGTTVSRHRRISRPSARAWVVRSGSGPSDARSSMASSFPVCSRQRLRRRISSTVAPWAAFRRYIEENEAFPSVLSIFLSSWMRTSWAMSSAWAAR